MNDEACVVGVVSTRSGRVGKGLNRFGKAVMVREQPLA